MLILASGSPRRHQLLSLITSDFSVIITEADESIPPNTSTDGVVTVLAGRKADTVFKTHPQDIIIGADTLVEYEGELLGKPQDAAEAARMLRQLSGKAHRVYTGVCVIIAGERHFICEESTVHFHELSGAEIADYIATGEPMDKAGAYGIQEKGSLLVRRIEGDYFNIMGLPVAALYRLLRDYTDIAVFK